ncbi:MAG: transposase [Clostridiaceae bacterium]|nr:transposase [Clostridiaceae bacterium]
MPRTARQISKTHIYHVMLRGNEKKNIFPDEKDKARFIDIVYRAKGSNGFCLYAYCIMDNHVHLAIKEQNDSISQIMKRIGTTYAIYFNKKYNRVGHVFQDRYRSETIENERQLLAVIRYIHNNPVKAGICKKIQEYKWSSYPFYVQGIKEQKKLLEYEEILSYFSEDKDIAINLFKEFSNQESNDVFMDLKEDKDMLDEKETLEYINNYLIKENIPLEYLKQREYRRERDVLVKELIEKSQLSLRKIAEILGINRETVRKINMSKEPSL